MVAIRHNSEDNKEARA